MKQGHLGRKATKRRGDGVEFNLFDMGFGGWIRGVLVDHVIRPEDSKRQVLCEGRLSNFQC